MLTGLAPMGLAELLVKGERVSVPRVALVTNIPTPYRNPCYRELARVCDLRVFFNARSEPDRDWKFSANDLEFPHEFVGSIALTSHRKRPDLGMKQAVFTQVSPGLPRALARFRPDVVIGTAFGPSSMLAMAYARFRGAKFILWSEGTPHTEARLSRLRNLQRRMMVKRADGFWSNGAQSTQLLDDLGRAGQPVQEGMTGIDTRVLRQRAEALSADRAGLRRRLGLNGTVFLFVGTVSELKGVPRMAAAFREAMSPGGPKATLLVAGRGPLAESLEKTLSGVPSLELRQLGFVEPARLPELYAAADVFVLPTLQDNWSLAVLEAAVAGVPQVFSVYNGGSRDLMDAGAAGVMIDPLDEVGFAATLRSMVAGPPPRPPAAVLERISDYYSPESFARRGGASVSAVLDGVPVKA